MEYVGVPECVSLLRSVVQLLIAFAAGGFFVVLLLFVFASVGILVGADFREFPFRKCSFVDIKESASNGTMWLWVITTSGQADLWGGNNRPPRKSLPGAAAAKLAPRTVAASSQVCVREEGETKVQAKFPVFIQDLTGKRHCVMVEGGWDVHDLTRWAAVTCGVPAGAFYWTFQSRKWGDHGELMNDVGRDARLAMCGRLCGGANQGAKFGLPIEGEWTCSNCGMTRCWPVRKTCFRCGASRYPAGQQGQSKFHAQARAQAEREIREVINRVLQSPPKGTAEAPTYRKPKKVPAPTKLPVAPNNNVGATVDPGSLQAALDMLAALLPQEMMAVIQEQVKPRVVPPVSRTRQLADLDEKLVKARRERDRLDNVVKQKEEALQRATDLRDTKASEVVSLEEEVSRLRVEVSVPTPTPSLQGEEDGGDGPVIEDLGDLMEQDDESMPEEYLAPSAARKKLRRGQDDPAPPGPPSISTLTVDIVDRWAETLDTSAMDALLARLDDRHRNAKEREEQERFG